jgi:predicted MPP superfamily phosphohydrolase
MTPETKEIVTLVHIISAIVFLAAGGCIFLIFLNRVLLRFKDGKSKTCIIVMTAFILTAGPALLGYIIGASLWILVPIFVLIGIMAGEIRRAVIRSRCQGTPPIERKNVHVSLKRPFTNTDLIITRYEVRCPNWRGQKLRIVHISDLHISEHYPSAFYQNVITHINEAEPDLLFITGDFVNDVDSIPLLPDILTPLSARYKTFAILGNHDYWVGANEIENAIRSSGITLLRHECHHIHINTDRGDIVLCGYEYPWSSNLLHIPSVPSDAFMFVLTHTPDNIYQLIETQANAVFAGHYHAGQFRIPYIGSIVVPSIYGRRFDHGHFIVNGTHLFVTSGLGAAVFPLRLYCQPDIFIVDFTENP